MNQQIVWTPGVTLEAIEKLVIQKAFIHFAKNKTQTAIALGISIRTLDTKLEGYKQEQREHEARVKAHNERQLDFQRRARGPARDAAGRVIEAEPAQTEEASGDVNSFSEESGETEIGYEMEPADETSAEHALPVSKRKEIQAVPPKNHARDSGRRHR